jgi:hypothetical protein
VCSLHLLFGSVCLPALDVLDKSTIIRYECPSGRYFYRVNYHDRSYRVFIHYASCTCTTFLEERDVCKHILATWLSDALKKYRFETITDEDYVDCCIQY